jgi:hypothetical protein
VSYELDTVVRRPLSPARLIAIGVGLFAMSFVLRGVAFLVTALIATGLFARLALAAASSRRVHIVASEQGLRIGQRLVPRAAFHGALLKHQDGRTFVALRGRTNLDVEVPNNLEGDALVRALGLDAASSTLEVALTHAPSARAWGIVAATLAATILGTIFGPSALVKAAAAGGGIALIVATIWAASRLVLHIGADGLAFRGPLRRREFIPHEKITHVASDGDAIVLGLAGEDRIVLRVGGMQTGQGVERQRALDEQRADEAAAVVRRIQQAQRAFHEHAAGADALTAVLDRGRQSAREWLDQLRRVGEGAEGAFRTMGVARSRLFELVESTNANASERIAAAIAIRTRIAEDEKPRVRVAAERCAEPELRERMIRILDAEDDELEKLVEELSEDHR